MLQRLLGLVAEAGVQSPADLAQGLDVGEGLVEQMLEDLERRGYLQAVTGDSQKRCADCSFAGACAIGPPMRVWRLTGRGRRLAQTWRSTYSS